MAGGSVVILNGTPRSGKSSIASAITDTFDGVWVNLGVDVSMAMTSPRQQPGIGLRPGGERPDLEPAVALLYRALFASVAAHARLGVNVVVDVGLHEAYSEPLGIWEQAQLELQGLEVLMVGVRCPVEVVRERRRDTWGGMGFKPTADGVDPVLLWEHAVHGGIDYDLQVDTSELSAVACAQRIAQHLR